MSFSLLNSYNPSIYSWYIKKLICQANHWLNSRTVWRKKGSQIIDWSHPTSRDWSVHPSTHRAGGVCQSNTCYRIVCIVRVDTTTSVLCVWNLNHWAKKLFENYCWNDYYYYLKKKKALLLLSLPLLSLETVKMSIDDLQTALF